MPEAYDDHITRFCHDLGTWWALDATTPATAGRVAIICISLIKSMGTAKGEQPMIIDPLAIAALIGFGILLLISFGLIAWVWKQSGKAPGER